MRASPNVIMRIEDIKKNIKSDLNGVKSVQDVDDVMRRYLGRKGILTAHLRAVKDLSIEQRKTQGGELNELKENLNKLVEARLIEIRTREHYGELKKEWLDVTRPSVKIPRGSLHPITKIFNEAQDIFSSMGFGVVEGPQIETSWYNFDALNIPPDHPARDLWDTFWLKSDKRLPASDKLLLRTHTSPMQVRYMQKNKPPFRIIVPGRVFRYEATDASHHFQFYQIEGLMVADDINVANFKAVIEEFYSRLFNKDIKTRLRPSYFPFVEPGFEVDMSCITCDGKGCSVCSKTGWLEMMGAGMVHPKVFAHAGYNPKNLTGFAFGMGLDRLAMMKYKIDNVRLFYSGDLRFLQQFK